MEDDPDLLTGPAPALLIPPLGTVVRRRTDNFCAWVVKHPVPGKTWKLGLACYEDMAVHSFAIDSATTRHWVVSESGDRLDGLGSITAPQMHPQLSMASINRGHHYVSVCSSKGETDLYLVDFSRDRHDPWVIVRRHTTDRYFTLRPHQMLGWRCEGQPLLGVIYRTRRWPRDPAGLVARNRRSEDLALVVSLGQQATLMTFDTQRPFEADLDEWMVGETTLRQVAIECERSALRRSQSWWTRMRTRRQGANPALNPVLASPVPVALPTTPVNAAVLSGEVRDLLTSVQSTYAKLRTYFDLLDPWSRVEVERLHDEHLTHALTLCARTIHLDASARPAAEDQLRTQLQMVQQHFDEHLDALVQASLRQQGAHTSFLSAKLGRSELDR